MWILNTLFKGEPLKVSPKIRIMAAAWLTVLTLIAWPVTSLTFFAGKSLVFHVLLGLSWSAITVTCLDILCTTDVRAKQEGGDE